METHTSQSGTSIEKQLGGRKLMSLIAFSFMPLFFGICFSLGAVLFAGFLYEKEPNFHVIHNSLSLGFSARRQALPFNCS